MTEHAVDEELTDEEAAQEGGAVLAGAAARAGLYTPHRLFALTDGVFAIAMTLLALDVRVPDNVHGIAQFNAAASTFYGNFGVFIAAFVITGRFWLVNHRMLARLKAVDDGMLNRAISFLAGISAIPVATAVLFRFGSVPQAVTFAALLLAVTSLLSARLWWYVSAPERRLIEVDPDPDARTVRLLHLLWSPPVYLLAIPVAYGLEHVGSGDKVAWATLPWLLLAGDGVFVRSVRRIRARRAR